MRLPRVLPMTLGLLGIVGAPTAAIADYSSTVAQPQNNWSVRWFDRISTGGNVSWGFHDPAIYHVFAEIRDNQSVIVSSDWCDVDVGNWSTDFQGQTSQIPVSASIGPALFILRFYSYSWIEKDTRSLNGSIISYY